MQLHENKRARLEKQWLQANRVVEAEREKLRKNQSAQRSALMGWITGDPYKPGFSKALEEAWEAAAVIYRQIGDSQEHIAKRLDEEMVSATADLSRYQEALDTHLTREKRKQEQKRRSEEEKAELRARAAAKEEETRGLAASLRRKLIKEGQDACAYCNATIGETPHLDHIYPVSKGGQSTIKNLVFVCQPCNSKKSDLTLAAFIKKFALDRGAIEGRLATLNKVF